MTFSRLRGLGYAGGLAFAVAAIVAGCGGQTGPDGPVGGSESHFLAYCEDTCGDGLDCISGVCTRACVVDQGDCSDLAASSVCTAESIEPGAVAVCDVGCSDDEDCSELGSTYTCEAGFCRRPAASGGSGGSGSTGGSGGSGGEPGSSSCQVGDVLYEPGTEVPNPDGCGYCTCEDGVLACNNGGCSDLIWVPECSPVGLLGGDPIAIEAYHPVDDRFVVDVSHGGGCEEHRYEMCYQTQFEVSDPPTAYLFLTHDANDDPCDAFMSATLTFDVSELISKFGPSSEGLIFGPPGEEAGGAAVFGVTQALGCSHRSEVARSQTASIVNAHQSCKQAADCRHVDTSTSCNATCGAVVNQAGAVELEASLESIELSVCGECEGPVPTCVPPGELDCVEGVCVEVDP